MTPEQAAEIRERFGTPVYVYDERSLRLAAESLLDFPHAYGLTARYAMKACSNAAILKFFDRFGLQFDASSGFECERAFQAGIDPEKISLSSQELADDFTRLLEKGIHFNACSLLQIERFGQRFPGHEIGLRFNPGLGSGSTNRTNTGGPAASFGIWHEHLEKIRELVRKFDLVVNLIHTHIGSGSDPALWQRAAGLSLDLVREFPHVRTLNLGGGFKVGRMPGEPSSDLSVVGQPVKAAFIQLYEETGRKIHLELEPGTYLMANAGSILTTVRDIVDTGQKGYKFLKLDTGMNDILRPSLYGAQHPIVLISGPGQRGEQRENYAVVGHCCESGDLLTPQLGESELLAPREMDNAVVGDLCVIEGTGAYCSSLAASNYNSFPQSPEVLLQENGEPRLIRQRQTLDQILQNEV